MEIPASQSRLLANVYWLVTLALSDEDFGKLVAGKANAQRLFMSGKLKVKGDVMKATKLDPILKKAQTVQAKL
jgi:putative sterol carrier protein